MLIGKNTPFKTVKLVGSCTPTLPFRILKIIQLKKAALQKFFRTRSRLDYLTFKKLASRCGTKVRFYRFSTEIKVMLAASLKSFYDYVNRILSPKPKLRLLYSHTNPNTLLNFDIDKANAFNNYFHSVFTLDNGTLPNFLLRTANNMALFTFSVKEVCNVLKSSGSYSIVQSYRPISLTSVFCKLMEKLLKN